MADWIQQNLPNVYSLGWGGDFGWGIAIWFDWLTLRNWFGANGG